MTSATLERIRQLASARSAQMSSLFTHPSGLTWCKVHTRIADDAVRALYEDCLAEFPELPPIAVIATGGYGREELSPSSDIDISVVPLDENHPHLDGAIRRLFQDIHTVFGSEFRMGVGYSYRLISDAPGLDAKSRTGLLDMRLVAGSVEVFQALDRALIESFSAGEFVLNKIRERDLMFLKHHDTPLVAEPHLKEGAGGVRCFHCANWIAESIGEQPARPDEAFDTVVRARNLLHMVVGKPQDLFSRQRQAEIADRLGVDPYAFLAEVVEAGTELHARYRRARVRLHETRFQLAPGMLSVRGEARLLGNADRGHAAVGIAVATQLGLNVPDIPMVPGSTIDGPAALYAITTGEATLRNLDRSGILESLLPELTRTRFLMPRDPVHHFSVFEHTMRVLRHLDTIPPGTFLADIRSSLNDLEPLYLAALLHDVGKIDPGQDHSILGAAMAGAVCERWEIAPDAGEVVEWAVREHLTMSRVIRIQDLDDPNTIRDFAAVVKNTERLGLLTLLTYADVSAVMDGAWTPALDTFLRELYARTYAHLQGQSQSSPDASSTRQRLLRQLKGKATSEAEVQAFVESLPATYMTSTPSNIVQLHMEFARKAAQGSPSVEFFHRSDLSATEVTVCAADRQGLLSLMLGVFYAFDLSVSAIRACTTDSEPPIALDTFTISFGGRPVPAATAHQLERAILEVLSGAQNVTDLMQRRGKDPDRTQEVFRYSYREGIPGVLEIRAPRGRGMPYRFSRLLADQGWAIVSARVGQWAGNGAATFYVLDGNGQPISAERVQTVLCNAQVMGSA